MIYASTNSGASWIKTGASSNQWYCIASSADGTKLVAGASDIGFSTPAFIYTSTNSGATWQSNNVPIAIWLSVASSADGRELAAVCNGGIYTSTNSGATWQTNNSPFDSWHSVTSSADGNELFATAFQSMGGIWAFQTTSTPSMNITQANGNFVLSWIVPSTNFVMQQSSDMIRGQM